MENKFLTIEREFVEKLDYVIVSFGNYILERRKDGFISEQNQFNVTDADWQNWLHEYFENGKIKEQTTA